MKKQHILLNTIITGPGESTKDKRVNWSHQLTNEEAERYTLLGIFSENGQQILIYFIIGKK